MKLRGITVSVIKQQINGHDKATFVYLFPFQNLE